MSSQYPGADSFPADVTIPDDGDLINASSFDTPYEQLADRTVWLKNRHQTSRVLLAHPGWGQGLRFSNGMLASGSADLIAPQYPDPGATKILTDRGIVKFLEIDVGNANAWGFSFQIPVHDGATLTQVRGRFKPNPTHAAIPALRPKFGVVRSNFSGTDVALLSTGSGFVSDSSPDLATYNAEKWITLTPDQNNVIDRTQYNYAVVAYYEGHGNSLANGSWNAFELTFSSIPSNKHA